VSPEFPGIRVPGIRSGTTKYYHDGFSVLFETNNTGSTTRSYVHGGRIDEILSSSESKAFLSDGLGSTRALTDAAGQQTKSYTYDVFGSLRSETGTGENNYLFTGRDLDRDLGIYYYRNRWYDPSVGRFVTKDPIGMSGGENYYNYVDSNPINWTDPSGLIPLDTIWDTANVIYDIVTGNWGDLALDATAMAIPYVPAGLSKTRKAKQCYVIGENMERVKKYANKIGAKYYKPRSKNSANWMKNNRRWGRGIKERGDDVVDIGIDKSRRERSPYYAMEDREFSNYPNRRSADAD